MNTPFYTALIINILYWPIVHVVISYWALNWPLDKVLKISWLFDEKKWERGGKFYEDVLKVKKWKNKLPDGASLLGYGFKKGRLSKRDADYLKLYANETCRGELAHWVTFLMVTFTFIWNPWWAHVIMVTYAILGNLPCIIAQRYNRACLRRLLIKSSSLS